MNWKAILLLVGLFAALMTIAYFAAQYKKDKDEDKALSLTKTTTTTKETTVAAEKAVA